MSNNSGEDLRCRSIRNKAETSLTSKGSVESSKERFNLKQKLGLGGGIAVIINSIVGSGIFVSPTGVLSGTNGSVGLSLVLWAACGIIAMLVASCYMELVSMFPESGSEYAYLKRGYGRAGPTLAFMFIWASLLISQGSSRAGISLVFGSYLVAPFYDGNCDPPDIVVKGSAAVIILSLAALNYCSVRAASKLSSTLAIAKFIGMGIIIIGGIVRLMQRDSVGIFNFNHPFEQEDLTSLGFTPIGLAFYQGLWSYEGYSGLNYIAEEVKNPKRTVPLAITIGLSMVTVFYLLVNVAYLSVLTPEEMLVSNAVALTWGYRVLGSAGWIMTVVVCLSTLGTIDAAFLSGGRLPYVAARNGNLPQIFGMATVDYHSPGPSIMWGAVAAFIYLIPNNFRTLVNAFSFTNWLFNSLVIAAVIILRFTHRDHPRLIKVPILIPIIALIIAVYLVVAPLVEDPDIIVLYAVGFILCAPVVYFIFVYEKVVIPGLDRLTVTLQKVLNVAPTDWKEM